VPVYPPPVDYRGTPTRFVLPAGHRVWRIHGRDAGVFTTPRAGGRFDGAYGVCYAALDPGAAVADALLGWAGFGDGARVVRRVAVAGLRACAVATVTDLALVDLCSGPALAAVAQDGWLVTADGADFPLTRRWGSWIRSKAEWAQGFVWATGGSADHRSVVLFADRCEGDVLDGTPHFTVNLEDEFGAVWLNSQLLDFDAYIEPPRKS
jgi:hypothetical protein